MNLNQQLLIRGKIRKNSMGRKMATQMARRKLKLWGGGGGHYLEKVATPPMSKITALGHSDRC